MNATPGTPISHPIAGSLLDGITIPPAHSPQGHEPHGHRKTARADRPFIPPLLKDNRCTRWIKGHRRASWTMLAVIVLGAGFGAYRAFRFIPPPDYATAPMDELLDYTLITDDFNRLPIDQRLDLLRELVQRFASMEGSESVMMAQWASLISGELRDQMMKNASLLAIDLWDNYASKYANVPPEERGQFMDATVVEFLKTMESFDPNGPRNISDEKRLEEAKSQAARDQKMIRSGELSSGQLGRMADFMRNGMGRFAAPQVQTRAAQLMRDMTRHLRGQDIATGKAIPGGGGGGGGK